MDITICGSKLILVISRRVIKEEEYMRMVCSNCDLGLKRSDCTDLEYTICECRRWMIETINQTTLLGFMHVLDEVLETVYENKNDLRNNKARMIEFLSKGLIE